LLVIEPLVTIPIENKLNAPSVIIPSITFTRESGFFTTLNDKIAHNPAKKKVMEDTAPCARLKSLVKRQRPLRLYPLK